MYLIYLLPQEINDEILITIGNFDLAMQFAISFKRFWAASQLYNCEMDISQEILMNLICYFDVNTKNDIVVVASKNGYDKIVKILLSDSRIDPSANNNAAIRWASQFGRKAVVELLLSDSRVDQTTNNNYAINVAAANGHEAVVRMLLDDPQLDTSNRAIGEASKNGHIEVVAMLLIDPRIDPSNYDNYAIHIMDMKMS